MNLLYRIGDICVNRAEKGAKGTKDANVAKGRKGEKILKMYIGKQKNTLMDDPLSPFLHL